MSPGGGRLHSNEKHFVFFQKITAMNHLFKK